MERDDGEASQGSTVSNDPEENEAEGWSCCGGEVTVEEAARRQKMREYRAELTCRAKKNADNLRPMAGISLLARPLNMGYHFGVGIGLYFQMLEWLIILFSCITLLAFPFWIVVNQSVFLDEANKNKPEFGFKAHEDGTNLLESTFAAIIGPRQDPNNTLAYMLTKLGDTWHGPQTKDSFLLWISILDVVGVVLMIILVTYFTWRADKFEDEVDKDSYDVTDYTVVVSGLPPDAGVHEVGAFFSKYGDIIDVTLVLDMEKVLLACAKAAKLDHKRVSLFQQLDLLPTHLHGEHQW
ncbi:hypothetical protein DUNSADRAFT_6787 [Dunaliella salina]|uniref:RRM domain-containing protein n=1 Tax=Dunaliella salina TaxID=3046 RepID=A0ABQ7GMM5_DUNSA|nr:hypothetical protein DUNSADRAFT_6787 [Dunaliella salina]|eukprot:KAF5835854.1 hypothetical protein DUNSADRAFT_6787 [Dunaliella salina]